jgi:hypothetical protein
MHHNERERQWHRRDYRSGFQPSPVTAATSWGDAPGYKTVGFQLAYSAMLSEDT